GDEAVLLLEQHREQVLGRELRVAALVGEALGGLDRLLRLDREAVWVHSGLGRNLSLWDLDSSGPANPRQAAGSAGSGGTGAMLPPTPENPARRGCSPGRRTAGRAHLPRGPR